MVVKRRKLRVEDRNVKPSKGIPPARQARQRQQLEKIAEEFVQQLYHAIVTTPEINSVAHHHYALMRYLVTGNGRYLSLLAGLSIETRDWVRRQFVIFCKDGAYTDLPGQQTDWYKNYP